MRSRSSRVLYLCLLAGCVGGPISEFPFGSDEEAPGTGAGIGTDLPGGGGAGVEAPPSQGGGGEFEPSLPGSGGPDGSGSDAGTGDEVPCGRWPDADAGIDADANVAAKSAEACQGDHCGFTLHELRASAAPSSVCLTAVRDVCENRVQDAVSTCARWAPFALLAQPCERSLFELDTVSDACLTCYTEADRCTANQCASECGVLGSETSCVECRQAKCGPTLSQCSGLSDP